MSMEDKSRSGSDAAQSQQTAAEIKVDEPTDRKDDVDWRSYVAKYNVPLEVCHEKTPLTSLRLTQTSVSF